MDTRDRTHSAEAGRNETDTGRHDSWWRQNFRSRPYVAPHASFDDYGPAFRYGCECVKRYEAKSFDAAEAEMREEWTRARGASRLEWDDARAPIRDAWDWAKTHPDHD